MKFRFFLIITILTFTSIQAEETYALDECLDMARSYSKRIEATKSQIDVAEGLKNEARSYLLPHINVDGRYEIKNGSRDFSAFSEYGGSFSTKTIGVSANLLLFDGFSAWNQFQAGKWGVVASQKNLEKAFIHLEEEVKIAYFRVLETDKGVHVVEDSIKTLRQQLKTVEDFFEQGMVAKTDVLSVEVQLAEKRKALLRAYNERIQARMNLNRHIGKDLLHSFLLQEVCMPTLKSLSSDNLHRYALSHRQDIKALKAQIEALESRYRAALGSYGPKLFAFGGYNRVENTIPQEPHQPKPNKNWISGGVGLQFPLYEGGKTSAEVKKIKGQISEAKANLEDLELGLLMEVNNAYFQWQEQYAGIAIDKVALSCAEENLRSTTDRYAQGLVSINDLLKAEEQLSHARMNSNRTLYRYHMAHAHLISVVGGISEGK
ncbi:MAG: TolC family protein [Chlamydiota bacterium]